MLPVKSLNLPPSIIEDDEALLNEIVAQTNIAYDDAACIANNRSCGAENRFGDLRCPQDLQALLDEAQKRKASTVIKDFLDTIKRHLDQGKRTLNADNLICAWRELVRYEVVHRHTKEFLIDKPPELVTGCVDKSSILRDRYTAPKRPAARNDSMNAGYEISSLVAGS